MRKLARGVFGLSAGLALAGGGVLAFGQAQLTSSTAQAGDGSFNVVNTGTPVGANGLPNDLYDNATDTAVLQGYVQNTSGGQGQNEVITGAVQNIQDAGFVAAGQGNASTAQANCESFLGVVTGNVPSTSGKVGWAPASSINDPNGAPASSATTSPTLTPGTGGGGDFDNYAVYLNMASTGQPLGTPTVGAATDSACAHESLTYDIVFTSSLP